MFYLFLIVPFIYYFYIEKKYLKIFNFKANHVKIMDLVLYEFWVVKLINSALKCIYMSEYGEEIRNFIKGV